MIDAYSHGVHVDRKYGSVIRLPRHMVLCQVEIRPSSKPGLVDRLKSSFPVQKKRESKMTLKHSLISRLKQHWLYRTNKPKTQCYSNQQRAKLRTKLFIALSTSTPKNETKFRFIIHPTLFPAQANAYPTPLANGQ